ncbi:thiamine/thiamine pyrophosphate ABC transporter, permease protein [Gilliamella sp. wkB178]|uniref:thiamine/thiamine pyrophosphate ABC transporter permease n=1 Tax=Gilliamella sp. wkB178 TaxID=3120259 RepID=UPI00080D8FC2|nr:thiamine/thiamine pyrophosphate ABC transporter permease [Gilliamella apicola]OCG07903.1 thiamine/thiamine pyrophosphate ABC transporter, permease protein [Gilliamella apicola]
MLKFTSLIPGISVVSIILIVLGTALFSLWGVALHANNWSIYFDSYLLHVVAITIVQALLSTVLAIGAALLMAKALSLVSFKGKTLLLRFMPITFILPTLVLVTGLLSVYGQQGLIANILQFIGLSSAMSVYGLHGILLAHIFLNFPYACSLFHQTLTSVPVEQKQLAAQLNFSSFNYFKLIEWPLLRRQLFPIATLIFMLCFSSFAIVLALGGGPKYTTIEVEIYQSIRNFELMQAVVLAGLQLLCCLSFMWLMQKINRVKNVAVQFTGVDYKLPVSNPLRWLSLVIIIIGGLFIFLPIITVLVEGINAFQLSLFNSGLKCAFYYSMVITFGSAIIAMVFAVLLLWTNSRLLIAQQIKWSNRLMLVGTLILAIPSMVLAAGLFLLLFEYVNNAVFICLLMIICNALMVLPYTLKNLAVPMYDVSLRYWQLSQSLNISGLKHFCLIEYPALKPLLAKSMAFAAILSLGDFGIIALFGGQAVTTLPYYLYEQLSHYHYQQGMVTASILLLLSFILLAVLDYDRT